ncbi:MAG: redoxin domain-containing protein [Opitutae bacterium]|nr:redoxin domain-containing protein [Opitutae bacterium]
MKKLVLLFLGLAAAPLFLLAEDPVTAPATVTPSAPSTHIGPKPGELAPDFTVVGPDNREIKLSDFRGKLVLVDIWATWCGPCVASMPHNSEFAEKYAANDLVVLAVCADDSRANYDGWVKRNGDKYKFRTAHDPAGKDNWATSVFNTQYGVSGFPTLFLIGKDGKLIGTTGGGGPTVNPHVLRLLAKGGLPVDLSGLPPEETNRPKSIPMIAKTAAMPTAANPTLRFANMAAGETVPDFSTTDVNGKTVKLSDFRGKTVFINFWTGARNPPDDVAKIASAYQAQGLAVWAINTTTERADFEKWAKETAAPGYTVSWDPAGKAMMEAISYMIFGAGMYPAYCVVGPDGKLVGGVIGMGPRVSGLLREILQRAEVKLNDADKGLIEQALAAARANPPASAPMGGGMLPAAKAAAPATVAAATIQAKPSEPATAVKRPATLGAGAVAPDFPMQTVDGRTVKLSDFKDKVVILDFWATWCGPCIASFPHTQKLAAKYKDQDVVVVASGTSDKIASFKAWIPKNQPKYPDLQFFFDPNEQGSATFEERASNKFYHVVGIPTQFIIGRDGKIAATILGNGGEDDARAEATLATLGVKVDAAIVAKGKEQLAKSAEEEKARAAAAADAEKNPPPPFRENFAELKAGASAPDVELLQLDGSRAKLSALLEGHVTVVGVWSGAHGPGEPFLAAWKSWSEKYPDVKFVGVAGYAALDVVQKWQAENSAKVVGTLVADPAGPSPRPDKDMAELNDEERAAFRKASGEHMRSIFTFKLGGVMSPIPTTLVFDAAGKLAGWSAGFGPRYGETMGNLLLRSGVKLAPADMPAKVWTAADIAAATPKPEPRVEMLKIGAVAPDFVSQTVDGKDVKLSDFRGKVVILDFWATWCGPCMASMPHTQEVAAHYKDQGVVVLANCTSDARAKFEQWVKANQAKYPDMVWTHDAAEKKPERVSRARYGVGGIPCQFIIDREGKIVDIVIGYLPGEAILEAALSKAGVNVDPALVAKGAADLKRRG